MFLSACGGGSTSSPPAPLPPPPAQVSKVFKTEASTAQFLNRATFGARQADIDALKGTEVSNWIKDQFAKPATLYRQRITDKILALPQDEYLYADSVSSMFLDAAIAGDDQLRQRMTLALSEILVASSRNPLLDDSPEALSYYVDILSENAFGNYRDILEKITYSPAMAAYLTYLRNQKGDPDIGRVPDENYAREIMQLFSIGLEELNMDGTRKLDANGQPIPTYSNKDITELAKVFTGLSTAGSNFWNVEHSCDARYHCPEFYQPLEMFDRQHSPLEKKFLNTTIPAGTSGTDSIQQALDGIFAHPNVAPFISRQLIQRFVTSNPEPAYVERVATAFENGTFTLPDGSSVGTGKRGDLKATIAAVLLDPNAQRLPSENPETFGKIREPMIRLINWARAFAGDNPDSYDEYYLYDMTDFIGQHPFRAKHVFNFFEPEFIAPGTKTGEAGLTAPELEITDANTIFGYINFINAFIFDYTENKSGNDNSGVVPDYSNEIGMADDPKALVDHLNLLLTGNTLMKKTQDRIVQVLNEIPIYTDTETEDKTARVMVAISMVMTSPGYLVQR